MDFQKIKALLNDKGQAHLLAHYSELDDSQKQRLLSSIEKIDWSFEEYFGNPENLSDKGKNISPIRGLKLRDIKSRRAEFEAVGVKAIQEGKVAAVLLAGGQGTRLGVDCPKGAYDIGINKPLYIFEQQIKNLLEVVKKCGAYVPMYVMTSEKNYAETKAFWAAHDNFGYPDHEVTFFIQGMMPAVDFNGKIYLESKDTVALSPNGNGGWFHSLCEAGLLEDLHKKGIEWVNIYAVDNVLQRIADPVFIGASILANVNCGAKAVMKNAPQEKVGVLCLENGKPTVIEYYELSEKMANERDGEGELLYSYGVILNYLFRLKKLEETVNERIPVHIVRKKIDYLDEQGKTVRPERENGYKFERLAVDLIKFMDSVLPFEVDREKEFAPIKNKTGVDSVESARELLIKNGVEL